LLYPFWLHVLPNVIFVILWTLQYFCSWLEPTRGCCAKNKQTFD
jgi:hypothetical protein